MGRTAGSLLALLTTGALLLAGCSSSPGDPKSSASPRYNGPGTAAEPATAPPTSRAAPGTVLDAGPAAEGIVYDTKTDTLAVLVRDPVRLQLFDGETLTLSRTVDLPGKGRHLSLSRSGGDVLLADEGSESLLQIALPGGAITRTRVRHFPHDATQAANGAIFVADEGGRAISVVEHGAVVHTFTDVSQPAGVAAIGNVVAAIDGQKSTLSSYDAVRLVRTHRVSGGNGPTHIEAVSRSRFLVADTRGNALLLYASSSLAQTGRLALPGTPYGVAFDAQRNEAWITLTARNEVVGVSLAGANPMVLARYLTLRQPNTVAVDPGTGRVFVAGADDGKVQVITPG